MVQRSGAPSSPNVVLEECSELDAADVEERSVVFHCPVGGRGDDRGRHCVAVGEDAAERVGDEDAPKRPRERM